MKFTNVKAFADDLAKQFPYADVDYTRREVKGYEGVYTDVVAIKLTDETTKHISIIFEEEHFDTILLHTVDESPVAIKHGQEIDRLIAILEYIKIKLDI